MTAAMSLPVLGLGLFPGIHLHQPLIGVTPISWH